MSRASLSFAAAALTLALAACNQASAPGTSSSVSAAFATLPLAFDQVPSTFTDTPTSDANDWAPPGPGMGGPHDGGSLGAFQDGPPGAPGGSMMCGGLGGFFGGGPFGFGFGGGPFDIRFHLPGNCTFNSGTGRVTCDTVTQDGLTIVRSAAYTDASGQVQSAFDSLTTNTVDVQVSVNGTVIRHGGDTSVVHHTSDRAVTGLASGSTQHTVNGTSAGSESTDGTNATGTFTSLRTIGDTVQNVVVPVHTDSITYPISGSVIRSASVTVTYTGQSPTTSSRREVVTYNGTSTATVVITEDGVTKNCTLALPRGRPVCS